MRINVYGLDKYLQHHKSPISIVRAASTCDKDELEVRRFSYMMQCLAIIDKYMYSCSVRGIRQHHVLGCDIHHVYANEEEAILLVQMVTLWEYLTKAGNCYVLGSCLYQLSSLP